MTLAGRLQAAVSAALGDDVVAMVPVRGGDVAVAYRLELAGGGSVFAKTHPSPPPGGFSTEAASLAWLREADAVAVPEVLAAADPDGDLPGHLVLAWIDEGRPGPRTEEELGRDLAALHAAGAPSFGRQDGRPTGSRALPNEPRPTWASFYADDRLIPLARIAADAAALAPVTISRLERLAATLDRLDDGAPPARVHGDLWAGNRIVDARGTSWLVDPAAHGGHREFDLAMMRLFGGFGDACFGAYAEAWPLAPGWEDRVSLHQIAPLVVHAVKFGGGYVRAATDAIGRW